MRPPDLTDHWVGFAPAGDLAEPLRFSLFNRRTTTHRCSPGVHPTLHNSMQKKYADLPYR
jgi:hypothetical protein